MFFLPQKLLLLKASTGKNPIKNHSKQQIIKDLITNVQYLQSTIENDWFEEGSAFTKECDLRRLESFMKLASSTLNIKALYQ